jgi:uncharacterized membrane protein YfcA
MNELATLLSIGLVAGFLSALFGVGGGIIVVPLLILLAHYPERQAAATSLGAIGLIALAGTFSYGLRGEVHWGDGLLLGLPAAAGAVAGTRLQQRITTRALTLSFAVFLAAVGVYLAL